MTKLSYHSYSFLLEKTLKRMKRSAQKILKEANAGVTLEQWRILKILYDDGAMSQNEIGEITLKDAPTATRIIDLLCKKKLTIRKMNKSDRRKFDIILTEAGTKKVKTLMPIILREREKGWKSLSDKDLKELGRILTVIHDNLKI
jgi:DNA-binding MarR family transcriptional regulator